MSTQCSASAVKPCSIWTVTWCVRQRQAKHIKFYWNWILADAPVDGGGGQDTEEEQRHIRTMTCTCLKAKLAFPAAAASHKKYLWIPKRHHQPIQPWTGYSNTACEEDACTSLCLKGHLKGQQHGSNIREGGGRQRQKV
jgi:hypothetical protein